MADFATNFLAGHMGAREQMRSDQQQANANALAPLQQERLQVGIDQTRQSMAISAERLQIARQQAAQAAAQEQDQQTLAKEAAQARQLLTAAAAGGPAAEMAWREIAAGLGNPDLEFTRDNLALAGATFDGIEDSLVSAAGNAAFGAPEPEAPAAFQALEMRAAAAGYQPGTPEYQQFMATGGGEASVLSVTPDGGVFSGPASAMGKFTEGQSKDNVYATRAEGALALLDSVGAGELTSRQDRILGAVPLGIGREAQSEDFQVAEQAGEEFLQAILRKDTGAAITSQEQDLYGKTYLPQPGDGPRVIEAKRAARIRALEAIKAGMSVQQVTVQQRALVNAARGAAEGQPDIPDQPPEYLDPLDADLWSDYTPDQRQIILRAYEGQR